MPLPRKARHKSLERFFTTLSALLRIGFSQPAYVPTPVPLNPHRLCSEKHSVTHNKIGRTTSHKNFNLSLLSVSHLIHHPSLHLGSVSPALTMSTSRPTHTLAEAHQLLQLSTLITTNIQRVIAAWAEESTVASTTPSELQLNQTVPSSPAALPSLALHEAQCTLIAATGKLTELIAEPSVRIIELGCQYWESRALYIAAERRVPDLLAKFEEQRNEGMTAGDLSKEVGIESRKLERVMRCLCSGGVFKEVEGGSAGKGPGEVRFANNRVSRALVGNEGLRAYVLLL